MMNVTSDKSFMTQRVLFSAGTKKKDNRKVVIWELVSFGAISENKAADKFS